MIESSRKTVAIIQARMGSRRLPGKVLKDIHGKPMLQRVIERVQQASSLHEVLVATSSRSEDDLIEQFCQDEIGVRCFRGPEEDVLERYYRAAHAIEAKDIVRVTGDCPLIDPGIVERVISTYRNGEYDYVSNFAPPTFPDGLDTEILGFQTLETLRNEAVDPLDREHVTRFIGENTQLFSLGRVKNERDLSQFRWTVDYPEDLEFVRRVYGLLMDEFAGMEELLELLEERPWLHSINEQHGRADGTVETISDSAFDHPGE